MEIKVLQESIQESRDPVGEKNVPENPSMEEVRTYGTYGKLSIIQSPGVL